MSIEKLHVVIVYPGIIPVYKYGGTGRDIWYEGRELTRMGHRVTYLCGKGSQCNFAAVIPYDKQKAIDEQVPGDADLIHFHFTPREAVTKPYLVTIHGNPAYGEHIDINTVFVSQNHAARYGSETYIYNGMDWDDYGPVNLSNRRTHLHFLGKAAWRVKNLRGAIKVSRMAQKRLVVLGGHRLNFKMGFRFTLDRHVAFKGFVGGEEKFVPMRHSAGLVFPVLWNEPMGLAVIESLYFGAPVFGTPYGSLPELVHADVGYLSNSATELAEAIKQGDYNPKICHEYAVDQFNARKMNDNYIKLFEKVLNGETLNRKPPTKLQPDTGQLLQWFP